MLSLLAFLALRPRKGWLRQLPVQLKPGSDSSKLEADTPKAVFVGTFGGQTSPGLPPEQVVGLPLPAGPGTSRSRQASHAVAAGDGVAIVAANSALLAERLAALRSLDGASMTSAG